jgi:hypothetical protein
MDKKPIKAPDSISHYRLLNVLMSRPAQRSSNDETAYFLELALQLEALDKRTRKRATFRTRKAS